MGPSWNVADMNRIVATAKVPPRSALVSAFRDTGNHSLIIQPWTLYGVENGTVHCHRPEYSVRSIGETAEF
jgi:hypothetical protein